MRRLALLLILAAAPAPAQTLYAGGSWAALRFGERCEAASRPLPPASRREPQARAGVAFNSGRPGGGAFHARLSRQPRPGSSVILTIGSRPFLLVVRGAWAWSRGPAQDAAIRTALRSARSMRIAARDSSSRRFADHYLLAGAPTAIDAAAAACAGKI